MTVEKKEGRGFPSDEELLASLRAAAVAWDDDYDNGGQPSATSGLDRLLAKRDEARAVAGRAMACLRHCGCEICRGELQAMDDALRGIPSTLFPWVST